MVEAGATNTTKYDTAHANASIREIWGVLREKLLILDPQKLIPEPSELEAALLAIAFENQHY